MYPYYILITSLSAIAYGILFINILSGVFDMWNWFMANGIWILSAASLALSLVLIGRGTLIKKLVGKKNEKNVQRLEKALPPLFWTTCSLLLLIIVTAIAAIMMSEEGASAEITTRDIQLWLLEHGMPILLIIVLSVLIYRIIALAIPRLVEQYLQVRAKNRHSKLWYQNRTQTLSTVLTTTTGGIIAVVAIFMLLSELNINITPLLAGAGVAGVAVGLGAQSLIKDYLSGMFIFMEDHYNKGDVVEIAGRVGTVEEINLRRTVLRDIDGIVYSIPNGEISISSNYTRDWARVKLDVPVSYRENLDRVFEILNRVGKELAEDKVFSAKIKTAPQVLRVQQFNKSSMDVRMLGDVKPNEQWVVTGELRRRIKKAFDAEGIEISIPNVKLYFGDKGKITGPVIICSNCQTQSSAENRFCGNCGQELEGSRPQ
jgi:small-conductance mechanosensitive channel